MESVPIYKRCSRCGSRILTGSQCQCGKRRHKEYDKYSRDLKSKNFYNGREWAAARRAALELDGGVDVFLYMTTGEIEIADTVHHIVPIKDEWDRRTDINNLMSLNHNTHSTIERKYKEKKEATEEELMKMLSAYREMRKEGGGLKSF